jgi:hypothetical protein
MIVKTSYPVLIDGVNKTPNLYYDSEDGQYSEAQGRRKSRPTKRVLPKKSGMAVKKPNRPISTKGTRVITMGGGSRFDKRVTKSLDRPQYYNASGEDFYDADGNGLKVFTTYPVIINKNKVSPTDYYLNADGEQYLPFDGQTELLGFRDELGEEYFCGVDGEDFYNAKGEKLKGFFKKVGGGVVKVGQFIGKVAKKVGRTIVEASKKVVSGVKTAGGKVKAGAEKLLHHKTKAERTKSKADRDKKRADREKEHNEKIAKRNKEIADAKAKGQTPPPKIEPLTKEEELKLTQTEEKKAEENKTPDANASDVFTLTLPLANANTPKDKIVVINGKEYDASGIPDNKQIVQTIDENGNPIAGVEYDTKEVVAVTGGDGNIQYYTNEDAGGMSKGLKIALIVGGAVVLLAVAYFVFKRKGAVTKISS